MRIERSQAPKFESIKDSSPASIEIETAALAALTQLLDNSNATPPVAPTQIQINQLITALQQIQNPDANVTAAIQTLQAFSNDPGDITIVTDAAGSIATSLSSGVLPPPPPGSGLSLVQYAQVMQGYGVLAIYYNSLASYDTATGDPTDAAIATADQNTAVSNMESFANSQPNGIWFNTQIVFTQTQTQNLIVLINDIAGNPPASFNQLMNDLLTFTNSVLSPSS